MCVTRSRELVSGGVVFFFQAEDGIRDLVRSRGLGDVYKRQGVDRARIGQTVARGRRRRGGSDRLLRVLRRRGRGDGASARRRRCLLYTSDAADERSSVDLGGRRIIKKKAPPPPPPFFRYFTAFLDYPVLSHVSGRRLMELVARSISL